MRRLPFLVVLVAALLVAQAPAQQPDPLGELTVSTSLGRVPASAGSGCRSYTHPDGSGFGGCGDAAYPLPLDGRVPVRAGQLVAFDFGAATSRVYARLLYADGTTVALDPEPDGAAPVRRWIATLPSGIALGTPTFDVGANYDRPANPSGDQHFQAGAWVLRPRRGLGPSESAAEWRVHPRPDGRLPALGPRTRRVRIDYLASACLGDPGARFRRADVVRTRRWVVIRVVLADPPPARPGTACTSELRRFPLTVDLGRALGPRRLRDGAFAPPRAVAQRRQSASNASRTSRNTNHRS